MLEESGGPTTPGSWGLSGVLLLHGGRRETAHGPEMQGGGAGEAEERGTVL